MAARRKRDNAEFETVDWIRILLWMPTETVRTDRVRRRELPVGAKDESFGTKEVELCLDRRPEEAGGRLKLAGDLVRPAREFVHFLRHHLVEVVEGESLNLGDFSVALLCQPADERPKLLELFRKNAGLLLARVRADQFEAVSSDGNLIWRDGGEMFQESFDQFQGDSPILLLN